MLKVRYKTKSRLYRKISKIGFPSVSKTKKAKRFRCFAPLQFFQLNSFILYSLAIATILFGFETTTPPAFSFVTAKLFGFCILNCGLIATTASPA